MSTATARQQITVPITMMRRREKMLHKSLSVSSLLGGGTLIIGYAPRSIVAGSCWDVFISIFGMGVGYTRVSIVNEECRNRLDLIVSKRVLRATKLGWPRHGREYTLGCLPLLV